jgi:hypothetical protein
LAYLITGSTPSELDIVVVANACTDDTALIAGRLGVRVIETPIVGKAYALRLGDEVCVTFPRVYLDADVMLSAYAIRLLVAALDRPGILAAAPTPQWDLDGASWVMRRVHVVHDALLAPYRGLAGVGAYVLGEAGHARTFPIPDIVSDDEWVHRSFSEDERQVVAGAKCVIRPPTRLREHIRRRVRIRVGNRQLDSLGKPARSHLRASSLGKLLARHEVTASAAACYLAVLGADRVVTFLQQAGILT